MAKFITNSSASLGMLALCRKSPKLIKNEIGYGDHMRIGMLVYVCCILIACNPEKGKQNADANRGNSAKVDVNTPSQDHDINTFDAIDRKEWCAKISGLADRDKRWKCVWPPSAYKIGDFGPDNNPSRNSLQGLVFLNDQMTNSHVSDRQMGKKFESTYDRSIMLNGKIPLNLKDIKSWLPNASVVASGKRSATMSIALIDTHMMLIQDLVDFVTDRIATTLPGSADFERLIRRKNELCQDNNVIVEGVIIGKIQVTITLNEGGAGDGSLSWKQIGADAKAESSTGSSITISTIESIAIMDLSNSVKTVFNGSNVCKPCSGLGCSSCGGQNQPCCSSPSKDTCLDALSCKADRCVIVPPPCGHIGEKCCQKNECQVGTCQQDQCVACGGTGQPCCSPPQLGCLDGTVCQLHQCIACGGAGQPCCASPQPSCRDNAVCQQNQCTACGSAGQPCCASLHPGCRESAMCQNGGCVSCGNLNESCCPSNSCGGSLSCDQQKCLPPRQFTTIISDEASSKSSDREGHSNDIIAIAACPSNFPILIDCKDWTSQGNTDGQTPFGRTDGDRAWKESVDNKCICHGHHDAQHGYKAFGEWHGTTTGHWITCKVTAVCANR